MSHAAWEDDSGRLWVFGGYGYANNGATVTFGTTDLTSAHFSGYSTFLVKYDSNGNALWARKAGGGSNDEANGIAVDGEGSIYVTGYFSTLATLA
mgnify:CR=1 FL=1